MAKSKKKKKGKGSPKPEKRTVEHEPCPSCGEARPLFWHGRRVLCEACIEDNTHAAERGEVTGSEVIRGAVALFRDVGWWVVGLIAGYTLVTTVALKYAALDESVQIPIAFGVEIVGLLFTVTAYDLGLRALDGEERSLAASFGIGIRKFLPALLAQSLAGMIIVLHFVFLIVPGIVKSLSYAIVMPLVISGEAGAISCLHESYKRMKGHRKALAPLVIVVWVLPFLVIQYVGSVALLAPEAVSDSPAFATLDAVYPLFEIPWLFIALSIHAKLRARHRISAD